MKKIHAIIAVYALMIVPSFAVLWDAVTVHITVKQGGGSLGTLGLTNRSYLNFVSNASGTPKSDLFIGIREDNGQLAVVRRSDETVLFTIVTPPSVLGFANNGSNTNGYISASATIASLNTNFAGVVYDHIKRAPDSSITSIKRTFTGGSGNQVIKGTVITTGKKFNL